MQLTGKQIVEKNIISNYVEEGVQQQGIDVRIDKIGIVHGSGQIPREGKTIKCKVNWMDPMSEESEFVLNPGYYEIILKEGCKIPSNAVLNFKTRSSLVRCGATIHSGQFDAGFETECMGCFLEVRKSIKIERGARIAQAIITETYPVEDNDLYKGQWQNDNQREDENVESVDDVNEVTQVVENEESSVVASTPTKSKKRKRKN